MPKPINTVLCGRIVNACTIKPRTRTEVRELLQINIGRVEHYMETMCARRELHKVGIKQLPTGHRAVLYSAAPATRYTGPTLTVWRGPVPTEWRM